MRYLLFLLFMSMLYGCGTSGGITASNYEKRLRKIVAPEIEVSNFSSYPDIVKPGDQLLINIGLRITNDIKLEKELKVIIKFYSQKGSLLATKSRFFDLRSNNRHEYTRNLTESIMIPESANIGRYYYEVEVYLLVDKKLKKGYFRVV